MYSKAQQSPASKLSVKSGRWKDYRVLLCHNSHWPQKERTWLLKVLSRSCPGWHCPGLHTAWGWLPQRAEEPWHHDRTHSWRAYTLKSWFVYALEVMTSCLRSYVQYDLGAQREAKSANRKPHRQDLACAFATSHGEQRPAVPQWAVVWTRVLQAKNLQIKEPLANWLLVSHFIQSAE